MFQDTKTNELIRESKNLKLSLRFGFFGIGMGGTSIAAACADVTTNILNDKYPYTAFLLNSTEIDHKKVESMSKNPTTQMMLIGDGRGAGREIAIGESLYKQNEEKITDGIVKQFKHVDFVWLVVGLGGGTGTGSVIQAIGTLMKNGFNRKFGLILTLPRKEEGGTILNNALKRLQQIYSAMNNLGPIILVDNQKLYNEFIEDQNAKAEDYVKFANKYVAEALHELNAITASYLPYGDVHFDSSEFVKMLRTPGLFHFARFTAQNNEIDASHSLSYADKFREQIDKGVLSEGYDLKASKRSAISVLSHKTVGHRLYTTGFRSALENLINSVTPLSKEKPVALYTYDTEQQLNFYKAKNPSEYEKHNQVYFYAIFSGLDLPEQRISELMAEDKRLKELEEELKNRPTKNLFEGFVESAADTSVSDNVSFDDLFGESKEENNNEDDFNDVFKKLGIND